MAFKFPILTAARTSEVLGERWDEINVTERLWTVPVGRMKAKRELATGSTLVFPGRFEEKPFSNMVFLMLVRKMDLAITADGFRSSFRDWAAECTSMPREVVEMALAHAVENRVEAAYARSDLLERGRELMDLWSRYLAGNQSTA